MKRKIIIPMTAIFLISSLFTMLSSCRKDDSDRVKLSSISIKTAPSKTDYYVGEALDLSELEITLVMNNGKTKDILFPDFLKNGIICSPANGTRIMEESTSVTITHSFSGKATNQSITLITLTDIDNNTYSLVKIGNQIWMSENLMTTKYNDGESIYLVTDYSEWSNLFYPGYCWFNNDQGTYKNIYGAFYNWFAVNTKKLCPTGWHVPSDEEWATLISFLGGESVAGGKMKKTGTEFWANPNINATNEVGFNGLPGGYRGAYDGLFYEEKLRGWWWSATPGFNYFSTARVNLIRNDVSSILVAEANKKNGIYVRCVKDELYQ